MPPGRLEWWAKVVDGGMHVEGRRACSQDARDFPSERSLVGHVHPDVNHRHGIHRVVIDTLHARGVGNLECHVLGQTDALPAAAPREANDQVRREYTQARRAGRT